MERGPGRPKGYFLSDGTRVPGVTTVISRFKESGALLQWAWKQGRDGKELYEERDKAADVGSLIHTLAEADIHGVPHPEIPEEMEDKVISGYSAWRDWWAMSKFEPIATEVPLVSEKHRFGGTLDLVLKTPSGLAVGDFKTSNSVYSDYLVQLAAYAILWEENREEPLTGGFHLMRFAKEHADFTHRFWPNLDEAKEQFLLFRRAYEIDKELVKRAK